MAITITLTDHQAEGLEELIDLAQRGREDFKTQAEYGDYDEADQSSAEARWTLAQNTAEALKIQHAGAPHPLIEAAENLVTTMKTIDTDNVWEHWNCGEIAAAERLAQVAGHPEIAGMIIDLHSVGDDEWEDHYNPEA